MRKDVRGNRLFKKLVVKVMFPPDVFPEKTYMQKAPAGKGFHAAGVDEMLMNLAEQLETLYPFWEFMPVPLMPQGSTTRYVFKFAGYRAVPTPAQSDFPNPESTTLELPKPTQEITPEEPKVGSIGNTLEPLLAPATSDQGEQI